MRLMAGVLAAQPFPSVLVGGICKELRGNVRCGQGEEFVAETDESDGELAHGFDCDRTRTCVE